MHVDNPVGLTKVPYLFREHCFSGLLAPLLSLTQNALASCSVSQGSCGRKEPGQPGTILGFSLN